MALNTVCLRILKGEEWYNYHYPPVEGLHFTEFPPNITPVMAESLLRRGRFPDGWPITVNFPRGQRCGQRPFLYQSSRRDLTRAEFRAILEVQPNLLRRRFYENESRDRQFCTHQPNCTEILPFFPLKCGHPDCLNLISPNCVRTRRSRLCYEHARTSRGGRPLADLTSYPVAFAPSPYVLPFW